METNALGMPILPTRGLKHDELIVDASDLLVWQKVHADEVERLQRAVNDAPTQACDYGAWLHKHRDTIHRAQAACAASSAPGQASPELQQVLADALAESSENCTTEPGPGDA